MHEPHKIGKNSAAYHTSKNIWHWGREAGLGGGGTGGGGGLRSLLFVIQVYKSCVACAVFTDSQVSTPQTYSLYP